MIKSIFFVLSLATLMGCQGFVTREGLRDQEQKKEISDRVGNLQKSNADVNNRFSEIESDLREMHGKVEVLENRINQTNSGTEKSKKATDEQLTEAQKKLTVLQEEVTKIQDQIAALATEMANSKSAPIAEKSEGKNEKNLFESGDDFFEKKEWRKAILNFQKFREAKPKDKKVAEAIYKIGVSFQELAMKEEAKAFFEELGSKFPNSVEAKRAKIRLKKIK